MSPSSSEEPESETPCSSNGHNENAPPEPPPSGPDVDATAEDPEGPLGTPPISLRGEQSPSFYTSSEMAHRIREFEWAQTPLGPIEEWPPELGTAVDIMLGAGEAISIYWGQNHILLYNDAWRAFIGEKHPEALGRPGRDIFPELWDTIGPKFEDVLAGSGAVLEYEQRLPLEREGHLEVTWFDYSFNPIPMADGSVGGVFNIGTEVTDRIEAEEALRQSEAFHRLAAEAGKMGTWSVDLQTGDAAVSARMAELMGYAPGEHKAAPTQQAHWQQMVPQEAWMASVHPDDRGALEQAIVAAREDEQPFELEFRVQHEDETRRLYAKGEVSDDGPNGARRLRGASVDITKRRELEEALVGATETVRRDIGRELHDVLSSDLAALAIKADNLARRLRQADASSGLAENVRPAKTEQTLEEIAEGVRSAAKQARNLSHVLMPPELQEDHLAAALEHLCYEQARLGTPAPTFEGDRDEPRPGCKETATHLYRIAQEAITNAQRHAEAEHIWVRLRREQDRLVLTVRDDGEGVRKKADAQKGIGLRTMEHRADLIGATLQVEPVEEGGTLVRCALPLSKTGSE